MNSDVLNKGYEPHDVEQKWYRHWETNGAFAAKDKDAAPAYSIVIPPPNVTGVLHMGHALNITLQDALCRYRRLRGDNVLWMPGTDHAGIATQNVVERKLSEDGTDRHALGLLRAGAKRLPGADAGVGGEDWGWRASGLGLELRGAGALVIGVTVGIIVGVVSALRRNSWFDVMGMIGALLGVSMPIFWLALILIYAFAVNRKILPPSGRMHLLKPDSITMAGIIKTQTGP